MIDTNTMPEEDLQSLITKFKSLDVARLAEDEALKSEALRLARKVTATLEGPVNRATDLVFRVYILQNFLQRCATHGSYSLLYRLLLA
jgi:hypothetical protein